VSNPSSAPATSPLSRLVDFFRIQLAGAPVQRVEEAVAGIEQHVAEEIRAAIEPLREEISSLRGVAPAVAADAPDLFAEIREEIAAMRARIDQIQPAPATDVSGDLKALHDRLVALETARPAAPARAAAPAARPATTA